MADPVEQRRDERRAEERLRMVRTVRAQMARLHAQGLGPRLSERVAAALEAVPRERFVPPDVEREAYADTPLPIGEGQTISQPLMVGLMSEVAAPGPTGVVLEVGTGSGYGAAVLARLARRVCTIEVVPALAERAAARLRALGTSNVEVRAGDAWQGWAGGAPTDDGRFDAIVVTCAAPVVPARLLAQLGPGGRLVLPLGEPGGEQVLTLVEVDGEGVARLQRLLPVAFVPMVRRGGGGAAPPTP